MTEGDAVRSDGMATGRGAWELLEALRRILRAITVDSHSLEHKFGLTGPQLLMLKVLAEQEVISVGELARRLLLTQATVTGIVKRLELKGLVARSKSSEDRRRVLVELTDGGAGVLQDAPPLLQERFADAYEALPHTEQDELLTAVARVAALMEAAELEASPILTTGSMEPPVTSELEPG